MSTLVIAGFVPRAYAAAVSLSSYAIFAGGTNSIVAYAAVDIFSSACSCMETNAPYIIDILVLMFLYANQ